MLLYKVSQAVARRGLSFRALSSTAVMRASPGSSDPKAQPANSSEDYDIVIVGGGPSGCALAGALGTVTALANMRIALVDPGKLFETMAWEPPLDSYLGRTVQITSRNMSYLESVGMWGETFTDRVQPYSRAVVTDASGGGRIELSSQRADDAPAYLIETKNLVSGMLRFIDRSCKNVDIIEKAKVTSVQKEPDESDRDTGNDSSLKRATGLQSWPTVSLSNKRRLNARLVIGTDGINSFIRKYSGIQTYGHEYNQYGLVANLCFEQLNSIAYQRFLPTGPIAILPFPGGFGNLVWSLDTEHVQLLKLAPEDIFPQLINAAFRLSPAEMEYLYEMISSNAPKEQIGNEIQWRLDTFAKNNSASDSDLPPTVAAITHGSRMSFPLRMRSTDRLVGERVALVGDAGHVMHPLAGQGLNMGLEDVQSLAAILESAAYSGEDIGTMEVLNRYNKERYAYNLAMQGIVDKVWYTFNSQSRPIVGLRSILMNGLDMIPPAKKFLIKNMMA